MVMFYDIYQQPLWMIGGFFLLLVWMTLWKGIGLWFSAKREQKGWFIALLLLNTLGLLPILYLLWFQKKDEVKEKNEIKKESKKLDEKQEIKTIVKKENKEDKEITEADLEINEEKMTKKKKKK